MDLTSNSKLRIAIVGGGIAGLTFAIALKDRTDVEIDLYEAAAQLTELGAGITVWPRTWMIFKSMGIDEDVASILPEKPTNERELVWTFRKADQQEGFDIFELYQNGRGLSFHRQDMQRVLLKHLPSFCQVHLKHRLDRYEENDDIVKLYFENGITSTHDVVVGADGIKSAVRQTQLAQRSPDVEHHDNAIFNTGTKCYRGLIPREKLQSLCPESRPLNMSMAYCGKLKHVIAYPVSKGAIINVVGSYSNPADAGKPLTGPRRRNATIDEILDTYSGWEEDVRILLSAMEDPISWAIQELVPLETYVSRRTALIGDAAHAMVPYLGTGAAVAIEDAYILGALFSRSSCGSKDVPRILEIYNSVRQPEVNGVTEAARDTRNHYQFLGPEYEGVKDVLSPEQTACFCDTIGKYYSWGWGHPEIGLERALEML